jgi:thiamine-phosphate pyrophosphorylase
MKSSSRTDLAATQCSLQGLYLILDPAFSTHRTLDDLVKMGLAAGVRIFQLRVKTSHTGEFFELAGRLASLIHQGGGCFIVNDRCDVALAAGADGVHLGQEDLSLADARAVLGPRLLVGVSTHNLEQAMEAEAGGANYIAYGPVFPTTSKANPDPVVGVEGLRQVCGRVQLPIVAIGGITAQNVRSVLAAGIDCVAVITAVLSAPDPAMAITDLVEIIGKPGSN